MSPEEIIKMALSRPKIQRALVGKIIKNVIFIPKKGVINIVTNA